MNADAGTMIAHGLTALLTTLFAALFLRLAGMGPSWMPSAPALLVAAGLVLAVRAGVSRRGELAAAVADPRSILDRHGFAIGLGLVAAVTMAVQLPSISADLGHQPLDIDEHRVADNVARFFMTGEVGHHTVEHYPGVFYWLLAGSSLLTYLHGLMEGTFGSVRAMPLESFVLAGRIVNVAIAGATTIVAGLIGRQMAGRAAGVMAAMIVGLAPLSIQTTTLLRNDPSQVLLVCAAVHAALASASSDRRRWPVMAGIWAGLAAAIKYTSVFALVPVLLGALARGTAAERTARAAMVTLGFFVAVMASNHFLWYDFPNFVRQLSDQVAITGKGHWGAMANPAAFHTEILARFGVGWALLMLAAGFGVHGLVTGRRHAWIFWAFPILYSWFTTKRPSQFPRWVLPLLPFVAVAGAGALVWIVSTVQARLSRRSSSSVLRIAAAAAIAILAIAQPLWHVTVTLSRRFRPATHQIVEEWLRGQPAGTRVLVGDYWLDLKGAPLDVRRVPDLAATLQGSLLGLAANDVVVVPEPYFGNPGLKRLAFVKRVAASQRAFGGNLGYDYEVYAPPKLPPSADRVDVRPGAGPPGELLSSDWPAAGDAGSRVPPTGASLFLPARTGRTATVTVNIAEAGGPATEIPIAVFDIAGQVALTDATSDTPGRSLTGTARLSTAGRPTEIRFFPLNRAIKATVLRVQVD